MEGFVDSDSSGFAHYLTPVLNVIDQNRTNLILDQPKIQPTGAVDVAVRGSTWEVPAGGEFMAIIPRDPSSTDFVIKQSLAGSEITPTGAVVLVGPYAIRGQILTAPSYATFVMQDAVIDYVGPGARLTNLAAPYLLVRSLLVQGIIENG